EQHGLDFSAKWSGKFKMLVQCIAVPLCLLSLSGEFLQEISAWVSMERFLAVRDVTLWVTVAITLYSGAEYVVRATHLWRQAHQR
ncbi:hypothetical protein ACYT69_11120, partial [Streptococcus pyogenes]